MLRIITLWQFDVSKVHSILTRRCEIVTNESKQASINSYYLTLVRLKYEDELRRESSLIQQATQIQVVFSFAIAFLYTALPVVLDELNPKWDRLAYAVSGTTSLFLLSSLGCATLAQWRYKMKTFPSFDDIKNELFESDTSKQLYVRSAQEQKLGKTLEQITESLEFTNNKRLRFILIAKILFAIALVCMFFSTITFIVCILYTTSSPKMW